MLFSWVQSSEFILVKTDKLTRKALTEPLPANSGQQPLHPIFHPSPAHDPTRPLQGLAFSPSRRSFTG